MNRETHETVIRRWAANSWNNGDFSDIETVFDSGYLLHDPAGEVHGPAGLAAMVAGFRAAFQDLRITVDDVLESGDRAAWRFTMVGTQRGEFRGIPASGRQMNLVGVIISRFEGERWCEDWVAYDGIGMLRQLGVLEPAAA